MASKFGFLFMFWTITSKQLKYSELDSSGSVTKLTTRVSLKQKFGETKLH